MSKEWHKKLKQKGLVIPTLKYMTAYFPGFVQSLQ
jgi:hypothetical protein